MALKNLPANAADVRNIGLVPGLGRSRGGAHNNPLQYSSLESPMHRGAWWATQPTGPLRVEHNGSDFALTADEEDGRLAPQNNHFIGSWRPGSFVDQRGRSPEEPVPRRSREGEAVGSKVKGPSASQSISKGVASLQKGCVNLSYSQVGRDKLSLQELNKGTFVYSLAGCRTLQASH